MIIQSIYPSCLIQIFKAIIIVSLLTATGRHQGKWNASNHKRKDNNNNKGKYIMMHPPKPESESTLRFSFLSHAITPISKGSRPCGFGYMPTFLCYKNSKFIKKKRKN